MVNNCSNCGFCCRLFLINLTEEEYKSGKFKTQLEEFGLIENFQSAASCGANILKKKKNGSCVYLKDNSCSIYRIRPKVCREFFCTSKLKKFRKMNKLIEKKQSDLRVSNTTCIEVLA